MTKLKNKLIRKTVVEGMSCDAWIYRCRDDGECVKEVSTLNIFLTPPINNCTIVLFFLLYLLDFYINLKNMYHSLVKMAKMYF